MIPEIDNPQSYNRYSYVLNNPLRFTDPSGHSWGEYWHDVGQVFLGYWDAGAGAVKGTVHMVAHPIQTAEGIGTAVIHPVRTGKAIVAEVENSWNSGPRGQGALLANLGMIVVPGAGEAGVISKTEKIAGVASKAEQAANVASKAEQIAATADKAVVAAESAGSGVAKGIGAAKRGETAATKAGREAHKAYEPGPGYKKELKLPSGKKADAVNFQEKTVKELKPNNPRAIRRGEKQVEAYRQELQKEFGGEWKSKVDTYEKK